MMNRRVLLRKGILRLATVLASIVALGLLGIVVSAGPAPAQSPSAYLFSGDADAYSSNVPWPTNDPNTGIVEAVDFCNYTYSNVEQLTVNWLNGNDGASPSDQVITEVTPDSCETESTYEKYISYIINYVEAHGAHYQTKWGGIMLDEESGYEQAAWYRNFNSWLTTKMTTVGGLPWWFNEANPGPWGTSTWNSLLGSAWAAPQAGTGSGGPDLNINVMNAACSSYDDCINMVTIYCPDNVANSLQNEPYATSLVNGYPWNDFGYWGNGYWWNAFTSGEDGAC
jgi:hypothetical protein